MKKSRKQRKLDKSKGKEVKVKKNINTLESKELKYYKGLLEYTYDELCEMLLNKYGHSTDDYFSEKSYIRFLNGEIKTITKRKITRTKEGLYCHHIDEDKQIMISDPTYIKEFNIPFEFQKKERLVYCDLIEHSALHILIAKENGTKNRQRLGIGGYVNFMRPELIIWFEFGMIPKGWKLNCYNALSLTKKDAINIINYYDSYVLTNELASNKDLEVGLAIQLYKMGF